MRDWSYNREDTFAEQSARMPRGPVGRVLQPSVTVSDGLPAKVAELVRDDLAGKLGTLDMLSPLEALKRGPR